MAQIINLALWMIALIVNITAVYFQRDISTYIAAAAAAIGAAASLVDKLTSLANRPASSTPPQQMSRKRKNIYIISMAVAGIAFLVGGLFLVPTRFVNMKIDEGQSAIYKGDYLKAVAAYHAAEPWNYLPNKRGDILLGLSEAFVLMGKYDNAQDKMNLYDRELAGKDFNQDARANDVKGRILLAKGKTMEAIDFFNTALKNWDDDHIYSKGFTYNGIASAHYTGGNRGLAIAELKEAQKIFDETNFQPGQALTLSNMGVISAAMGDVKYAEKLINEARSIYTQMNSSTGIALCDMNLGYIRLIQHDYKDAYDLFDGSLPTFLMAEMQIQEIEATNGKANAEVGLGKYDVGKDLYMNALTNSNRISYQHGIIISNGGLGGYYAKVGLLDQALISYDDGLKAARDAGNKKLIADILSSMGLVNDELGVYSIADNQLKEAETIYEELEDQESLAIVYLNQAMVRRSQVQNLDALNLLKKAKSIFDPLPNSLVKAMVYRELGNLALVMPNVGGSKEIYFDEAKKIAESLDDPRASALIEIDRCKIFSTSLQGALDCADDVASKYRSISEIVGQADIYYLKGTLYFGNGDWGLSERSFTDAKAIYESKQMIHQQGITLSMLGAVAEKKQDFTLAQINYDEANKLFTKSNFTHDIAVTNINIARLRQMEQNYKKAEQLLNDAQTQLELDQDYTNNAIALNGLGYIQFQQSKYDLAIITYGKALTTAKRIGDFRLTAIVLTNTGRCHLALDDLDTAMGKQNEAIEAIIKLPYPPPDLVSTIKTNTGEVLAHQGNIDAAVALYQEALSMIGDKFPQLKERILGLLKEIGK